jgi:hypothetical protein
MNHHTTHQAANPRSRAQLQGGWVMRPKRSNTTARITALLSLIALAASAFTAPPASALTNPERHYEMVSPPYKGGYGAKRIEAVSPDGESVAFFSNGAFAGAPSGPTLIDYIARRGSTEWSTAPLMPPSTLLPYVVSQDVSSSLSSVVAIGTSGANEEAAFQTGSEMEFLQHSVDMPDVVGQWGMSGVALKSLFEEPVTVNYYGADHNLCHFFVVNTTARLLPEALEAKHPNLLAYELAGGCAGEPSQLRLVGLNAEGKLIAPSCLKKMGITGNVKADGFNAISVNGREAFFSTGVEEKAGNCTGSEQLFVDLDGGRTVEVSRPIAEECGGGSAGVPCLGAGSRASATFAGASRDGSKVFFTTSGRLLEGEVDSSEKLYVARIGCGSGVEGEACLPAQRESVGVTSLVQASRTTNPGEAAEVQGVVRVAPDGSRVYFVARGVLGDGANTEGQAPVKGADNLYMYDVGSDSVKFVAELCSGPGSSGPPAGAVADLKCPLELDRLENGRNDAKLWSSRDPEAQTAGVDGRYLVFSSFARLGAGDSDTARDVYRYDSVSGVLERVTVGEAGDDANGNNGAFNATIAAGHWGGRNVEQYEMDNRAVSEDGSSIVFRTAEPLSPRAINKLTDVYEWHEGSGGGEVTLLSSGTAEEPVSDVVISEDGSNVFFITSQGLVPGDTDGAPDIYDARIGPGFPPAPAGSQECSGDACQGPLTNPAPLLIPGSVSQAPGENVLTPPLGTVVRKRSTTAQKLAAALKGCHKKHSKRNRVLCDRSARKRYGSRGPAKKGSHR